MKKALEALKSKDTCGSSIRESKEDVIKALEEALKQEQGEPVAWWDGKESVVFARDVIFTFNWTDYWTKPLYTTPQPRKPLTDERIGKMYNMHLQNGGPIQRFARAIESAHGIKE